MFSKIYVILILQLNTHWTALRRIVWTSCPLAWCPSARWPTACCWKPTNPWLVLCVIRLVYYNVIIVSLINGGRCGVHVDARRRVSGELRRKKKPASAVTLGVQAVAGGIGTRCARARTWGTGSGSRRKNNRSTRVVEETALGKKMLREYVNVLVWTPRGKCTTAAATDCTTAAAAGACSDRVACSRLFGNDSFAVRVRGRRSSRMRVCAWVSARPYVCVCSPVSECVRVRARETGRTTTVWALVARALSCARSPPRRRRRRAAPQVHFVRRRRTRNFPRILRMSPDDCSAFLPLLFRTMDEYNTPYGAGTKFQDRTVSTKSTL